MGEPGGLPSMGSHRVGHDLSDLAAAAVPLCFVLSDYADAEKKHTHAVKLLILRLI